MKMLTVKQQWKTAWSAARRLIRRMTHSWPKNKDVAVQHYNKKYREEVGNLPITMTIKSSICWFDRNHWKDQSVRRWLRSDIRRHVS